MPSKRILVVDDEPDIRELVSEILEDEGYAVDAASDGEAEFDVGYTLDADSVELFE